MGTTSHTHDTGTELDRFGPAAVATAGVGVAAVAARAASVGLPCPLLATTGVPCPACGMTRLADAVAHGRLLDAATTDPAGFAFLVVVAAVGATYLLAKALRTRAEVPGLRAIPAVLAVLLVGHWITTLLTGGFVDA